MEQAYLDVNIPTLNPYSVQHHRWRLHTELTVCTLSVSYM